MGQVKKWNSRKLLGAVALAALATWLLQAKVIDQAAWLSLMQLALGGYLGANVGQKAIEILAAPVRAWLEAAAFDRLRGGGSPEK